DFLVGALCSFTILDSFDTEQDEADEEESLQVADAESAEVYDNANENTDLDYEAATNEAEALEKAKDYMGESDMTYQELVEQLEHDGYTEEEATYAADNVGAEWDE
ncbi:MAG: Ltp family lipoprotein, partial [Eggerthellaceae bacterium]|nr:Ltp family lipoprotein [Eggerthellaceae bacterium]